MAGKGKIARGALEALTDAYKKTFAPETYYHATLRSDIEKFDPNAPPSLEREKGDPPRGASYFTSDPEYADKILSYHTDNAALMDYFEADKAGSKKFGEYKEDSAVYPVKLKKDYLFDPKSIEDLERLRQAYGPKHYDREIGFTHDYEEQILNHDDVNLESWMSLELPSVQEALKDAGFRGYLVGDEPGTIGLFYPDEGDVRSIFAKFDPKKSKSGNILASVPAGALATGALGNLVEEE